MNPKSTFVAAALLLCSLVSVAQKNRPKLKFGDVKPEDFTPTAYEVDSTADAVYIFDSGNSSFEGNNKGFFNVVFKRHVRIRLLHKKAFDDIAKVEITLFGKGSDMERLEKLEAATYNLEDNKVVATKLDKASLFKDKDESATTKKFTFPNIKEGSIIEYTYTVSRPGFWHIPSWYYQGSYPRLYSEYEVTIPALFDFSFFKQGYVPYAIDTAMLSTGSYNILDPGGAGESSQVFTWRGNTVNSIWAMKNVPALKNEIFTTTLANHVARIEFQLAAVKLPDQLPKTYWRSWQQLSKDLMANEDFGAPLANRNGWLEDDLKKLIKNPKDSVEVARTLYNYVRDNFSCTTDEGKYLSQSLKKVYQAKKGNVADLNLLLTAMLKNRGFYATPVILSTRDNGIALETFPMLARFNYVISRVVINDKEYLLDATQPYNGFGKLPVKCYNGSGRIIDTIPYLVSLSADSLKEAEMVTAFFINNDKNEFEGSVVWNNGHFSSTRLREKLKTTKEEDFFKDIKKEFTGNVEMSNTGIDSLQRMDDPVSYHYDLKYRFEDEDLIYFNPMQMGDFYKKNPFASAERFYPVEMPYCMNEIYVLNMEIPKGYKVEEAPKSARLKLNETEGIFEYLVSVDAARVQLRSKLALNKANFEAEDYQTLREFFAYVVKKHSEQIVFKKIK
ncbi:MAG: DUF3857 and transglutaminase domain-containing protein [Filimonas sp.]|nr:DUF3857 and transglutaminase domain-containing protein [Filimonas sp.]